MTTTELINLLNSVEIGGITKKPREISFDIPSLGLLARPEISISGTGDGLCGAELTLQISGGSLYREKDGEEDEKREPTWKIEREEERA